MGVRYQFPSLKLSRQGKKRACGVGQNLQTQALSCRARPRGQSDETERHPSLSKCMSFHTAILLGIFLKKTVQISTNTEHKDTERFPFTEAKYLPMTKNGSSKVRHSLILDCSMDIKMMLSDTDM